MSATTVEIADEDIRKLGDEVAKSIHKLNTDPVLRRESHDHRRNLERILTAIKNAQEGRQAPSLAGMDKLVKNAEKSYEQLKKNAKSNEDVAAAMDKRQIKMADTFADSIQDALKQSLSTMLTAMSSQQARRETSATLSNFLTGGLASQVSQYVDTKALREVGSKAKKGVSRLFSKGKVKGEFHNGIDQVPQEGLYNLDGGERVVSPGTNTLLENFLKDYTSVRQSGQKTERSLIIESSKGFFRELIDNDDSQFFDLQKQHKDDRAEDNTRHNRLLDTILFAADKGDKFWYNVMALRSEIWWRRFSKHPVANSLVGLGKIALSLSGIGIVMAGLNKAFSSMTSFLFGDKNTDAERQLKATRDVERAVRGLDTSENNGWVWKQLSRLGHTNINPFSKGFGTSRISDAQRYEDEIARGARRPEDLTRRQRKSMDIARKYTVTRGFKFAQRDPQNLNERFRNPNRQVVLHLTNIEKRLIELKRIVAKSGRGGRGGLLGGIFSGLGSLGGGLMRMTGMFATAVSTAVAAALGGGVLKKLLDGAAKSGKSAFGAARKKAGDLAGKARVKAASLGSKGLDLASKLGMKSARLAATVGRFGTFIARSLLGNVGLAFAGGNLVGTYVVNPLLETFDKVFNTNILGWIGEMVTRAVAFLENLPGIGKFVKSMTNGEATNALESIEKQKKAEEAEKARQVQQKTRDASARMVPLVSPDESESARAKRINREIRDTTAPARSLDAHRDPRPMTKATPRRDEINTEANFVKKEQDGSMRTWMQEIADLFKQDRSQRAPQAPEVVRESSAGKHSFEDFGTWALAQGIL